jgi:uncharacterized OB-fold protein
MAKSKPIVGFYDVPMWQSIERQNLQLQACGHCGKFRYPPGPVCPFCLSADYAWRAVSGRGTILSWVIFHKQYFEDHVPPYNSIAVRLDEGPILVSNLVGDTPSGSWISANVQIDYRDQAGRMQHCFRLRPAG